MQYVLAVIANFWIYVTLHCVKNKNTFTRACDINIISIGHSISSKLTKRLWLSVCIDNFFSLIFSFFLSKMHQLPTAISIHCLVGQKFNLNHDKTKIFQISNTYLLVIYEFCVNFILKIGQIVRMEVNIELNSIHILQHHTIFWFNKVIMKWKVAFLEEWKQSECPFLLYFLYTVHWRNKFCLLSLWKVYIWVSLSLSQLMWKVSLWGMIYSSVPMGTAYNELYSTSLCMYKSKQYLTALALWPEILIILPALILLYSWL